MSSDPQPATHPRTNTTHLQRNGWTLCGLRASVLGKPWKSEPDRGIGCTRCWKAAHNEHS